MKIRRLQCFNRLAVPMGRLTFVVRMKFERQPRVPRCDQVVIDELRQQLYLVSNTTSQVLVYNYASNQVVAKIPTGRTPLAGAMSMDGNFLYVRFGVVEYVGNSAVTRRDGGVV